MLTDLLQKVARNYQYESAKRFSDNPLAEEIRKDLKREATKHLSFRETDYIVKGSPGRSNWASVPWLGFFDPIVTTSAQREYYVVFLINPRLEQIYLSLNQGTTAVDREYPKTAAREVLRQRANEIRLRLSDITHDFTPDPINLSSDATLPTGYEAGHALGKKYELNELVEASVSRDLNRILDLYDILTLRGGITPSEHLLAEADSKDLNESRRYAYSRRIERARNVRKQVLKYKRLACEICGLDPKVDYSFNGPPLATPLEVHHLTPLYTLAEDELKRYRVPQDFALLCPTCHRMAHKQRNPSDLEHLRRQLRFKHMREQF